MFKRSRFLFRSLGRQEKQTVDVSGRGSPPSIYLVYGGDMRPLSYCASSLPQLVQYSGQGFNQLHLPPPALPLRLTRRLDSPTIQIISPILRGHEWMLEVYAFVRSFSFLSSTALSVSTWRLYPAFPSLPLLLLPSSTPVAPSLTSLAL